MKSSSRRPAVVAAACAIALGAAGIAYAVLTIATTRLVTNTTGGKNQNPAITSNGGLIVFTSNVDHFHNAGTIFTPDGAFDFNAAGNDFTPLGATHPNPSCTNCDNLNQATGNLYLWRQKKVGKTVPANSVTQLTFSTSGGFAANQNPDINQPGKFVAWDSDQDHIGSNPDGNREIFLLELKTNTITQITDTTSGGETANRSANLSDNGLVLVFDSSRDFSTASCTLGDGVTACANADGNSEIMVLDRKAGTFTQVTSTTGNGTNANQRARVSNDGRFVAFQSTRDFSGTLPGGTVCTLLDGVSPCGNTNLNGQIMLFDRKHNTLTQVTNTTASGACSGDTPSERIEISRGGKFISFQSTCEAELNPTGCGSCDGNDEVFLADIVKKKLDQLTISNGGFNHVPRVSGNGGWVVFESSRSYKGFNPTHARTIYMLKRNPAKAPAGQTGPGQLIEDSGSTLTQNDKAQVVTTSITGGFNSTIEGFGVSTSGKFITFDNQKAVGNQEIWFIDRTK